MRVDSISNNYNNMNFTGRNFNVKRANVASISLNRTSSNSGANSVILYFTALLAAFGFDKPLKKFINSLSNLY